MSKPKNTDTLKGFIESKWHCSKPRCYGEPVKGTIEAKVILTFISVIAKCDKCHTFTETALTVNERWNTDVT